MSIKRNQNNEMSESDFLQEGRNIQCEIKENLKYQMSEIIN